MTPARRTSTSDRLGRLPAVLAVLAGLTAGLLAGCGSRPDTTVHPDPAAVRYAPLLHPFRSARLMVDPTSAAARWQRALGVGWLDPITRRPQAHWVTSPQDLAGIPPLAEQARAQRALPVLVTYYIQNRGCTRFRQGAPSAAGYDRWIGQLIADLGGVHAAVILEPDAVPADCFDSARAKVLRRAVRRLAQAGQYVYLDAGHAGWRDTGQTAERLIAAGIQYAQGFSVNVSNRQTTARSYQWARELSDLVGNREFVIDTSRNGLGPPPDEPGRDDEWCNPTRQALGSPPQAGTAAPGLAALLWIKPPGESDGPCGGETTYGFAPEQARRLIVNTRWLPAADRDRAAAAGLPPPAAGG
jgi:endoglucanase